MIYLNVSFVSLLGYKGSDVNIFYFDRSLTPHLAPLIRELCLVDRLPFTVDEHLRPDAVINEFFLDMVVPQSPSPNTWKTYAEQLSMFFRFLESRNTTWSAATNDDLNAYYRVRRVQEGPLKVSARSWNIGLAAVRRLYEWAVRKGNVAKVPFDYKEIASSSPYRKSGQVVITSALKEKPKQKDIKYMTEEDFRERYLPMITDTKAGMRNALFVRLLMRSGLRADEAVMLKLSMLPDPDSPTYAGRKTCPLTITGKGDKERTVRVPKSWLRDVARYIEWDRADAVERWQASHPGQSASIHGHQGYVFLVDEGTPVTYSAMYKMMRTAGAKAGFNFSTHPHMIRHSYAIYQLSAMIKALINKRDDTQSSTSQAYREMVHDPLRKLQRLMGHASIMTTFIYLDYVDDIDDIVDVTSDEEGFGAEDGYENVRDGDVER